MGDMCEQFCYYPLFKDRLPEGFHVHHQDFNKQHNCPGNLILLEATIHNIVTTWGRPRHPYTGDFITREQYEREFGEQPPSWVTRDESGYEDGAETSELVHYAECC